VIKYAANSLFATLISFSNEIANICTRLPGVDARDVWRGVHLDRRIATLNGRTPQIAGIAEYLWHGLGFGGSCFPKDVAALQHFGGQIGAQTPILDAVLNTNNAQPLRIVDLLEQEFDLQGKRIAVLGLAFKPGTDDVRESPALPVIKMLRRKGAAVVVHDPVVDATTIKAMTDEEVHGAQDWASAVRNADACCLVTSWPEYRAIEPEQLKNLMRFPLLIDGRGIFDAAQCDRAGVLWRGIGFSPRADRAVARAEI
jgi:UDPglucose 6-dehydrogenase/GDP-mannose 6-dehydrogenase